MTDEKTLVQIGIKISGKNAELLQQMAEESGQKVTTVARMLLLAAIKQSQEGKTQSMPPYLRRFYGEADDLQEEDE